MISLRLCLDMVLFCSPCHPSQQAILSSFFNRLWESRALPRMSFVCVCLRPEETLGNCPDFSRHFFKTGLSLSQMILLLCESKARGASIHSRYHITCSLCVICLSV